ncbi:nischarin [Seminavis robusta]|uniref:Nischarin n=1 Tax=Seminavis robusta TaxID=568900 RepID=A0A9N8HKL6_9STRA|nr:nischarin [Seminavis robusta]|eukprot:Sro764_g199070.1 nischarin (1690) ;mRNA; r:29192-34261
MPAVDVASDEMSENTTQSATQDPKAIQESASRSLSTNGSSSDHSNGDDNEEDEEMAVDTDNGDDEELVLRETERGASAQQEPAKHNAIDPTGISSSSIQEDEDNADNMFPSQEEEIIDPVENSEIPEQTEQGDAAEQDAEENPNSILTPGSPNTTEHQDNTSTPTQVQEEQQEQQQSMADSRQQDEEEDHPNLNGILVSDSPNSRDDQENVPTGFARVQQEPEQLIEPSMAEPQQEDQEGENGILVADSPNGGDDQENPPTQEQIEQSMAQPQKEEGENGILVSGNSRDDQESTLTGATRVQQEPEQIEQSMVEPQQDNEEGENPNGILTAGSSPNSTEHQENLLAQEEEPEEDQEQSMTEPQQQQEEISTRQISRSPARSIVSSIVIRQTEETLQALQASLEQSSTELLRTLGNHLSQLPYSPASNGRPVGGFSLPASAIGWLASSRPPGTSLDALLPRLTHLRVTAAQQWPAKIKAAPAQQRQQQQRHQQPQRYFDSLQSFHRLRYSPTVDPSVFPNLQVLLLDQVPPDWVVRLSSLSSTLQVLRVERACFYDLDTFLFGSNRAMSYDNEVDDDWEHVQVEYHQLTHLKLSHCNLGEMTRGLARQRRRDNSNGGATIQHSPDVSQSLPLARMPKLQSLSLSHNEIRSEEAALATGISHASHLSTFDLSYNQITSLAHAPRYLGNLQTLILTGNKIESAKGIDRLYGLQTLALDHNCIRDWIHVAGLARLPELQVLKLKGNPCMETAARQKHARVMLLDLFREQRLVMDQTTTFRQLDAVLPVIDEKPVSSRELKALQQRAFRMVAPRAAAPTRREGTALVPPAAGIVQEEGPANSNNASEGDKQELDQNRPPAPEAATSTKVSIVKGRRGARKRRKASKAVIEDEPYANARSATRASAAHGTSRLQQSSTPEQPAGTCSDEKKEEAAMKIRSSLDSSGLQSEMKSSGLKLSFSITDVLLSLDPAPRGKETTEVDALEREPSEADKNGDVADPEEATASVNGKGSNVGLKYAEFDWPEPLPYVPKENLYPEFEWKVQTTISLSEEAGNRKAKAKKKKGKASRSQQVNRKKPPAMSTSGSAMDDAANKKKKSKTKKKKKKPPNTASQKQSPGGVAAETANGTSEGVGQRGVKKPPPANEVASVNLDEGGTVSGSVPKSPNRSPTTDVASRTSLTLRRSVSSDDDDDVDAGATPSGAQGASFPASVMDGFDDATYSSMGTNRSGATKSLKGPSRQDTFHLAEVKSKFLGMEQERNLKVEDNLESYFKNFVFPDFVPNLDSDQLGADVDTWQSVFFRYPRIQLFPKDRDLREKSVKKGSSASVQLPTNRIGEEQKERFVKVWKEDIVACGKPALRRLKPNRTAHFGFHGELSWLDGKVQTVSECRQVILCLSSTSFYIILDNDSLTAKEQKPSNATDARVASPSTGNQDALELSPTKARPRGRFPSPLPAEAVFSQAMWPHAVACHPLSDIQGITIGFGFQRMTLRVRNPAYPSAVDYTYALLTSNKMKTVEVLRGFQGLVKEATLEMDRALTEEAIKIDNDDRLFLDGLAKAVAPDPQVGPPEPVGAVLHYQILKQRWKHGQRGAVKRICVVTDRKIYLLDEEYEGDGSVSVNSRSGQRLGTPSFRLIDSADLQQVAEIKAADADPNATTIIIRPIETFGRTHRWRLLCRDRSGAEKLVEDVRKGLALID